MNLAYSRLYARSEKGTRAYGFKPYYKRENLTLVGAIGLKGFLGGLTFTGGINGQIFRFFIEQILVPSLWPGANVVMDNLPAHKVEGIREMIESVGASVIYLSPYSPDFNPIENAWSKLKQYLRSVAARTYEALDRAVTSGLNSITITDLKNWFTHCCYCT